MSALGTLLGMVTIDRGLKSVEWLVEVESLWFNAVATSVVDVGVCAGACADVCSDAGACPRVVDIGGTVTLRGSFGADVIWLV